MRMRLKGSAFRMPSVGAEPFPCRGGSGDAPPPAAERAPQRKKPSSSEEGFFKSLYHVSMNVISCSAAYC